MLTLTKRLLQACRRRAHRLIARGQKGGALASPVVETQNCLGDDLDPATLALMQRVLAGGPEATGLCGDDEAQIHELAFWRGVAFYGYLDVAPKNFPAFQKDGMLKSFAKTGWSPEEFRNCDLVEIGCGPLGMIEYLPGRRKAACDPLNAHYARLFRRARSDQIFYCSHIEDLLPANAQAFDLAICYNVLDHTRTPRKLFESFMELVKPGGRFLFQVNTVREGVERPVEHARMHPSPFTAEKIRSWIDQYSGDCQTFLETNPTSLNEYFFMAFGRKDRSPIETKTLSPARRSWNGSRTTVVLGKLKRFTATLLPVDTRRGRCARLAVQHARRMRGRFQRGVMKLSLEQVLRESQDRKGIVIYPPLMDWGWMRQRPHQLMSQFARAGYLAIFCSPKKRHDRFHGFARVQEGLYLCDNLDSLSELPDPILLISWAPHGEIVKRFRSPLVIYDYLDDLRVGTGGAEPNPARAALHQKLVVQSDIVLATARRLYEEVRQSRPDAIFCPNGVDYHHFHPTAPFDVPADLADVVQSGRPIIGYYGALAEWFDYDLVEHVASLRPDCHFVLIGVDLDGTMHRHSRLLRMANVRWLGRKTYEELPAYLQQFTVATIPFVINEVTKSTSPVKLFEYMAGGKPIVTTDMPECRESPCVLAALDSAEYLAMLDRAIDYGKLEAYRRLLDQQAQANTWEARVGELTARIETISGNRRRLSA